MILLLYGRMRVKENLYSRIFYAVTSTGWRCDISLKMQSVSLTLGIKAWIFVKKTGRLKSDTIEK